MHLFDGLQRCSRKFVWFYSTALSLPIAVDFCVFIAEVCLEKSRLILILIRFLSP